MSTALSVRENRHWPGPEAGVAGVQPLRRPSRRLHRLACGGVRSPHLPRRSRRCLPSATGNRPAEGDEAAMLGPAGRNAHQDGH